MAEILHELVGE